MASFGPRLRRAIGRFALIGAARIAIRACRSLRVSRLTEVLHCCAVVRRVLHRYTAQKKGREPAETVVFWEVVGESLRRRRSVYVSSESQELAVKSPAVSRRSGQAGDPQKSARADRLRRPDAGNGEAAARAGRIGCVIEVLHCCSGAEGAPSSAFVKGYQMPARYQAVRRAPRAGV
jgi:hypothetical protein